MKSLPSLLLALTSSGCVEAVIYGAYRTGILKTHEEMCCKELVENRCIQESYQQCKSSFPIYGGKPLHGGRGDLPIVKEECVQPHIIDGYCAMFTQNFTGKPHPRDTNPRDTSAKPDYLK